MPLIEVGEGSSPDGTETESVPQRVAELVKPDLRIAKPHQSQLRECLSWDRRLSSLWLSADV